MSEDFITFVNVMSVDPQLLAAYPEISATPVHMEVPVLWGDMDSAQHVNNLIYLRWSETTRIKLFEKIGNITFDGDQGVILGWQDIKYIFPLTYPDTAMITAQVSEIREDRFIVTTKVYSTRHHRISAVSTQSIIPYDYSKLSKAPYTLLLLLITSIGIIINTRR